MKPTEFWTMITAIATCGLAIFAVLAWRKSRRQLIDVQKSQLAENERLQKQISATLRVTQDEQLHREAESQVEALVPYLKMWAVAEYRFQLGTSTLGCLSASDIRASGAAWRLRHHRNYTELDKYQKPLEDQIVDEIASFLLDMGARVRISGTPQFIEEVINHFAKTVTDYQLQPEERAFIILDWQQQLRELKSGDYISTWYERTSP